MAVYGQGRGIAVEAEPFGLLTEGAAGVATIVLGIIALGKVDSGLLASIITIIIGVGLMVQAFNAAAEASRELNTSGSAIAARGAELGSEVMINVAAGLTGIILGILGLIAVHTQYLVPAALIVFGGALVLTGAVSAQAKTTTATTASGTPVQVTYQGSSASMSGLEILVGFAAVILGILSLILEASWVLPLVGFIAVGASLLMVSATFSGAVVRLFTPATA